MSLTNLLQLSYWFALYTPPLRRTSFITVFILLLVLLVLVIALKTSAAKWRGNPPLAKALRRLARPIFFLVILGGVFVTFRQLGALVLSARIWLALIDTIAIVWFVLVLQRVHKTYKTEFTQIQERRKYEAYLPKRGGK
ncbi:hypothetical protein HY477_00315 [Candidatus Uhrbacteria bacterium]|nr:hypothetical protein [Candidatus Uhrbacteria bacterium]